MAYAEGTGSTVSFGGSLAGLQSIEIGEITRDEIEISTLSTTQFEEYILSALAKGGDVALDVLMNAVPPAITGSSGTLLVTLANGRSFTGTAQLKGSGPWKAAKGEAISGRLTFKWLSTITIA